MTATQLRAEQQLAAVLRAADVRSLGQFVALKLGFRSLPVDEASVLRVFSALPENIGIEEASNTLVDLCTIGETYFLRHRNQLEWLQRRWLPGKKGRLRVLFAACSTGEEVWSFLGRVAPLRLASVFDVVAVDVCRDALTVAKRAQYGQWSLRGVDPAEVSSWLSIESARAQVAERLLEVPLFAHHNLLSPLDPLCPPGSVDLILCRNMLMYLGPEALRTVWGNLDRALAPGGLILTAATDPFDPGDTALRRGWADGFPVHARDPVEGIQFAAPGTPRPRPATPPDPPPPPPPATEPHGADAVSLSSIRVLAEVDPDLEHARAIEQARHFGHTGRVGLAKNMLLPLLESDPFDIDALLLNALLCLESGDDGDALESARKAAYLDPASPYIHYLVSAAARRAGQKRTADRSLRHARSLLAGLDASKRLSHADDLTVRQLREIIDGE